jgi:hypothetical protein
MIVNVWAYGNHPVVIKAIIPNEGKLPARLVLEPLPKNRFQNPENSKNPDCKVPRSEY